MRTESRHIPHGEGHIRAVIATPPPEVPGQSLTILLAHGAGGDMDTPLLATVHQGLADHGFTAIKFNFPYRDRGRRAPDPAPTLESAYRAVLAAAREWNPSHRIVVGGKSMGGRIATHLAAAGAQVDGVVLLGYPLHPARKPEKRRVAHLPAIRVPMLFIAGTRDALADLPLLRETLTPLTVPITLHVIEGADHSFKLPRSLGRSDEEIGDEITTTIAGWCTRLCAGAA